MISCLKGWGGEHRLGVVAGQLFADEGGIGLDGLQHQRFDAFQVFGGERPGDVEVVIESVGGGRADGDFGLREELRHGVGHDVGGAVSHPVAEGCDGVGGGVFGGSVVEHLGYLPG